MQVVTPAAGHRSTVEPMHFKFPFSARRNVRVPQTGDHLRFSLRSRRTSPVKTRTRVLIVASLLPIFGAVAAFGVVDDSALPPARHVVLELAAPDMTAQLEALADRDDTFMHEERIRRGDSVASLLTRLGVSDAAAERFIRTAPAAGALHQLRPGRLIQAKTDEDGGLLWLRYVHTLADGNEAGAAEQARALVIERSGGTLGAHSEMIANERRVELRSGEIRSSLFGATDAAGVPDAIATQIAEIFSGDIDFYRDLRRGDRFRVVYENFYQGGEFARPGRVLAVEFVNGGKSFGAVWYRGGDESGHYYGFDGHSLRRAFLRAPLEFTRISSGFGGRMHPIMNTWRQHTGVDYAAPQGTPVRSTGEGVVESVGSQGGYGNAVVIRHQGVYSTLYGHLSRFATNLKRGQRIEQGQLIGYVGMTGWATGPHLHYEFRINNQAQNPLTAALPDAPPIGRNEIAAFRAQIGGYDRQIAVLRAIESGAETGMQAGTRVVASAGGA